MNLIIFNNLSLYSILKELNKFFNYNLHDHIENIDILVRLTNENPDFLVITDKKINNQINHLHINKPVKINSLLEKMSIKLSKSSFKINSNFNVGTYSLDINSRFLIKQNIKLKLTQKEVEIIYNLKNSNMEKSPEKLQKEIWKHSEGVETHTVETHIYRLRKKINEKFNDDSFIINNKKGYRLAN